MQLWEISMDSQYQDYMVVGGPYDPMWDGFEPLELTAPSGGNAAARSAFTEVCDQCQAAIDQATDRCPECGRPVHWSNSVIFDGKMRKLKNARADLQAKAKLEKQERMSETTAFVLALARATAVTHRFDFSKGQELALYQYEQAYGKEVIQAKANEFKETDRGAGLVKHLIEYLAQYNPGAGKKVNTAIRNAKWG